jgi:hypothetical protein
MLRGAHFNNSANIARCAYRLNYSNAVSDGIGFRCVKGF